MRRVQDGIVEYEGSNQNRMEVSLNIWRPASVAQRLASLPFLRPIAGNNELRLLLNVTSRSHSSTLFKVGLLSPRFTTVA